LSKRLQRLEAQIVVERVANEFARKYSALSPCLLSLHDSLISTDEYVGELQAMLEREFEATIGFRPKIKTKRFNAEPILLVSEQRYQVTSRNVVHDADGRSKAA